MSVYTIDPTINNSQLTQTEADLYGSSRIGIFNVNRDVHRNSIINFSNNINTFTRGNKFFELTNHLGNVLATISDKKLQIQNPNNLGQVLAYTADIIGANDYYPFGMAMPGRQFTQVNNGSYRYGFNGKEKSDEINGNGVDYDFKARIYDARLGKFLSVDPLTKKFAQLSPYQFASNNPVWRLDFDGLEGVTFSDVYNNRANIIDWANDPDTYAVGLQWFSENLNPLYIAYAHLYEIRTAKDFKTGQPKDRTQAVGETGIDIVLWVSGDKVFTLLKAENIVEKQAAQNIAAMSSSAATTAAENAITIVQNNRKAFAEDFYTKAGFPVAKALEHVEGIDLTKKVSQVTLKAGTIIQQWVGKTGVGNYFTTVENGAAENLGMNDYKERSLQQFTLTKDVTVLKSTAGEYKGNSGGGVQYFSPEIKNNIKPASTPAPK